MSRNLCTSSCPKCNYTVKLSDLRGKPIEFRQYFNSSPVLGCRFDCECGEAYFAIWRYDYNFWGEEMIHQSGEEFLTFPGGTVVKNDNKDRFVRESGGRKFETGHFTIDLSYYESYNDETMSDEDVRAEILSGEREPSFLCLDDAEDYQYLY